LPDVIGACAPMWRSHPLAWERPSGGFRATVVGCVVLGRETTWPRASSKCISFTVNRSALAQKPLALL
jgi:hypothetical protein